MRYFGRRRLTEPVERTEVFQQCLFAVLTDTRTVVQDAFRNSLFHQELMIAVCESVRLVPNPLQKFVTHPNRRVIAEATVFRVDTLPQILWLIR